MYAGLQHARGEYVAIMDADLQHPPAMLKEMYEGLQSEEYDCVAARRESRKGEPPVRSFFARCFYRLINRISDTEIVDGACDFRMMKRRMVDAILSMGSTTAFPRGFSAGWDFAPSGCPMRMWSGWPARPSGPSGSYCSTPSRELWAFPPCHWRWLPCWGWCCVSFPF